MDKLHIALTELCFAINYCGQGTGQGRQQDRTGNKAGTKIRTGRQDQDGIGDQMTRDQMTGDQMIAIFSHRF